MTRKEPWLAATWALVFPGLGHFCAGKIARGTIWFILALGIAISLWLMIFSATGSLFIVLPLMAVGIIVFVLNIVDAYRIAKQHEPDNEPSRSGTKKPWLAIFLTLLCPGIGHLYLRRWIVGILFIVLMLVVSVSLSGNKVGDDITRPILFIIAAWTIFRNTLATAAGAKRSLVMLSIGVLVYGAIEVPIANTYSAYKIGSNSMSPTISKGDRVLVHKNKGAASRGKIVVAEVDLPKGELRNNRMVKRIVAVETDTVDLKDDGLYVNGQAVYQIDKNKTDEPPNPRYWMKYPLTVPSGHVFLLGDNFENSLDSRYFGTVPANKVLGQVIKVFWPPDRSGPVK